MTYSPIKKGSDVDRFLCKKLGEWVAYIGICGDQGSPGTVASDTGNQ
jgi:Rieske Fe-S protein